jgi:hypothetical protein
VIQSYSKRIKEKKKKERKKEKATCRDSYENNFLP